MSARPAENVTGVWSDPATGGRMLVPRRCTLDGFAEAMTASGGFGLGDVAPMTELWVRTDNSVYRIIVLQPPDSRVVIQGGRFFPDPVEGRLCGSSLGGSLLKLSWIGVGLRLEVYSQGRRIITSPVRAVSVQEDRTTPGPF